MLGNFGIIVYIVFSLPEDGFTAQYLIIRMCAIYLFLFCWRELLVLYLINHW